MTGIEKDNMNNWCPRLMDKEIQDEKSSRRSWPNFFSSLHFSPYIPAPAQLKKNSVTIDHLRARERQPRHEPKAGSRSRVQNREERKQNPCAGRGKRRTGHNWSEWKQNRVEPVLIRETRARGKETGRKTGPESKIATKNTRVYGGVYRKH